MLSLCYPTKVELLNKLQYRKEYIQQLKIGFQSLFKNYVRNTHGIINEKYNTVILNYSFF